MDTGYNFGHIMSYQFHQSVGYKDMHNSYVFSDQISRNRSGISGNLVMDFSLYHCTSVSVRETLLYALQTIKLVSIGQ